MSNFEISERRKNSIIILDLKGRIIYGTGSSLLHQTIRHLVEKNIKKILLNFSEVSSIDSSGFGELVGGYVAARRINGSIKLYNIPDRLLDLFKLTHLNNVFDIYLNEQTAVRSYRQTSSKVVSKAT